MLVLIDYDNVPETDRRSGVDHVVRKILAMLPERLLEGSRPRVRLYGGWYESNRLTRVAQDLSAQIREKSPERISLSDNSILADIELAVSTLTHPRTYVGNSYREQSLRIGLKCEARPWLSCASEPSCPLSNLNDFFDKNSCSHGSCAISPRDILKRREQKVVDSMMVADLAIAKEQGYNSVCIVSRDDDIWPGLCVASLKVDSLLHVSTAPSDRMPAYFAALQSPPYQMINWS